MKIIKEANEDKKNKIINSVVGNKFYIKDVAFDSGNITVWILDKKTDKEVATFSDSTVGNLISKVKNFIKNN